MPIPIRDHVSQLQNADRKQVGEHHPGEPEIEVQNERLSNGSLQSSGRRVARRAKTNRDIASMPYTPIIAACPWLAVSCVPIS